MSVKILSALAILLTVLLTSATSYAHRIKAMHQIEAAAKHLGVTLRGDAKDRPPQALSDDKLREARGLLQNVLGASEVQPQTLVVKHISDAIQELNLALSIR